MSNAIIEKIKRNNFIKNGFVDMDSINKQPLSNLIAFAEEIVNITRIEQARKDKTYFSLSSSLPLSGGREGCIEINCRENRLRSLSQFAALYSEKIYIKNYMSAHLNKNLYSGDFEEDDFRYEFANDIYLLNMIAPLIEDGIIVPLSPPVDYCPHCIAEIFIGRNKHELISKEKTKALQDIFTRITVSVYKEDEIYYQHVSGLEGIASHDVLVFPSENPPGFLLMNPILLSKIENGEEILLSKTKKKVSGLHKDICEELFEGVIFELLTAQCLNTSFLTDSDYQVNILSNISKSNLSQKNKVIQKHLTTLVPFIDGLDISDLLKIRKREQESFILFRKAMSEAIDTCKGWDDSFADKDASDVYHDIIRPQLSKLDVKVNSAKRDLANSTLRKSLGWTAAISFGIYNGFIPSHLAGAATALGFTKVAADFLELAMNKSDVEETIRSEDMYFLWKVRQQTKKGKG